jgi:hypothetical protein
MEQQNDPRTGLAEKTYGLLLVGIPLLTAIVELISKLVNYGNYVRELRV